jgi:hypothetical protein
MPHDDAPRRSLGRSLAALVAALVGCGGAARPVAPAVAPPVTRVVLEVAVEPALLSACEVHGGRTRFDFDPAVLDPPDSDALKRLAHCLARGPLAGRRVCVVDRADPARPGDHEVEPGRTGAATIGRYLAFHGVPRGAVEVRPGGGGPVDAPIVAGRRNRQHVDIRAADAGCPSPGATGPPARPRPLVLRAADAGRSAARGQTPGDHAQ